MKNRLDGLLEQLFQACRLEAIFPETAIARLQAIIQGKPQPVTTPAPTDQATPSSCTYRHHICQTQR